MQGHVDGAGILREFAPVEAQPAQRTSWRLSIDAPPALARYIATKGSIAVDGVSLTVNRVESAVFEVNVIAHTLEVTTLRGLVPGKRVNLEVDLMARYAERLRTVL